MLSRVLLLALLASPLCAQRTWIVDANNGPGTDFTDLPPALAAASSGDTLIVRPGNYQGGTTAKALRILGTAAFVQSALTIQSLPQGSTATRPSSAR